jgi:two-component system sensor histidine kinase KdpD
MDGVRRRAPLDAARRALPYLGSAGLVAAALLLGHAVQLYLDVANVSLVFLVAVLGSAVAWGLLPSLLACVLSVAAFNFFFLPPVQTLTIADPENIVALIVFAVVAVIASQLTARTRQQMIAARQRERTTAALYEFSRDLAGIGGLDDLLEMTVSRIAAMLRLRAAVLLPSGDALELRAVHPSGSAIDDASLSAARAAWRGNFPAGRSCGTIGNAEWLFLPLRTDSGVLGVLGVAGGTPQRPFHGEDRQLFRALVDQAAVAIERVALARRLEAARVEAERERLLAALLASVSHDLRTPLASIVGAISSLRSYGGSYDAAVREELLATAQEEAERLDGFVGNILDLARLDSGAVEIRRGPVDLAEIVGTALRRMARVLAAHRIELDLPPDLPLLDADDVLLEQVLVNLFDNAAKYAPAGTAVRIAARREGDRVAIEVADEGPGIPSPALARVFDKFYRAREGDRRRAGTGLGLAICRGFVAAMGGSIEARNAAGGTGAVLTATLPIRNAAALVATRVPDG